MKFTFTDQKHSSKISVWYGGIYLGELYVILHENKDIDWAKYRSDKSLKLSPEERYVTKYIPTVKIDGQMVNHLKPADNKDAAAQLILDYHRESHKKNKIS